MISMTIIKNRMFYQERVPAAAERCSCFVFSGSVSGRFTGLHVSESDFFFWTNGL
ncbi:hypothetical protein [Paenibacillus glucanolyticus]|uniref:hypothetical protein n=2 Tax=Paenibacillus TaxID=44249 RepID=UPI0018D498FF|nr:hypothetical protein [Paenibacillus glucanolyticus]